MRRKLSKTDGGELLNTSQVGPKRVFTETCKENRVSTGNEDRWKTDDFKKNGQAGEIH